MGTNNGPKILGMGTERLKANPVEVINGKTVITPMTHKGHKNQTYMIMTLDWNGELYTVRIGAPISPRQALTASYWSEMTVKFAAAFRSGLKDKL